MQNSKNTIRYIALTGVLAALIVVFTAFFLHIPIGMNGGYIHLGDTLIYIAACMLPTPYACAAAAVGGGLADLLTAPVWVVPTVIIKALIVLPFTSKDKKFLSRRNMIAPWIALALTAAGYYIAEAVLFGEIAAIFTSLAGSLIQAGASAVLFYVIGGLFDKSKVKSHLAVAGRKP